MGGLETQPTPKSTTDSPRGLETQPLRLYAYLKPEGNFTHQAALELRKKTTT